MCLTTRNHEESGSYPSLMFTVEIQSSVGLLGLENRVFDINASNCRLRQRSFGAYDCWLSFKHLSSADMHYERNGEKQKT